MTDSSRNPTTTDAGVPVPSDEFSLTVGPDGPVFLKDHSLIERMANFNRERIPERQPHAKESRDASGAFAHAAYTKRKDDDERNMRRCFELAADAASRGELPFGSVVAAGGGIVAEGMNRVREDGDVTRHAEAVAIAAAQRKLGRTSLEDCTLFSNIEPCAACSYAIRETRIRRVVVGLTSPAMGGFSHWGVLSDDTLHVRMPEVFGPPPQVVSHFLCDEASASLRRAHPAMWVATIGRDLLRAGEPGSTEARRNSIRAFLFEGSLGVLRTCIFDRFARPPPRKVPAGGPPTSSTA